ncbi:hypothetical protein [uncultured Tateyamaria sp.]|uniref:hypothetical protein n=1 Tax=uncultured Tateyamaria sp. TaxID=455651 RepID=UPI002622BD4B|nr:hypothetical protein [uncultured Tateyamaria sp.]
MRFFTTGLLALTLCNCAPKNLYVGHDTILGLNAKINQGRQDGQLLFGYDRDFTTIIPTQVRIDENETEAMSLVHCTELQVNGIYLDSYADFTATGTAARNIAQDPDLVKAAASCDPLNKGGS